MSFSKYQSDKEIVYVKDCKLKTHCKTPSQLILDCVIIYVAYVQ